MVLSSTSLPCRLACKKCPPVVGDYSVHWTPRTILRCLLVMMVPTLFGDTVACPAVMRDWASMSFQNAPHVMENFHDLGGSDCPPWRDHGVVCWPHGPLVQVVHAAPLSLAPTAPTGDTGLHVARSHRGACGQIYAECEPPEGEGLL